MFKECQDRECFVLLAYINPLEDVLSHPFLLFIVKPTGHLSLGTHVHMASLSGFKETLT